MYRSLLLLLPLVLPGPEPPVDVDHDTFLAPDDCDEQDVHVHPHAPERANGRDDDCNGLVDDDVWTGGTFARLPPVAPTPQAAPIAAWTFRSGGGDVVYDAGALGLDGRVRGGRWTDAGLALDGGWVSFDHPELRSGRGRFVVRFRTDRGGALLSCGEEGFSLVVGDGLVVEVAGRRWAGALDVRDGEWHEVELALEPVVELVVDDVLLLAVEGESPRFDGAPLVMGAASRADGIADRFYGEIAEARLEQ